MAAVGLLLTGSSAPHAAGVAGPSVFQPSTVTFRAEFRGINAGTIALSLRQEDPEKFVYESRSNARGLARLIIRHEILEASTFIVDGNDIRPLSYILDDGSADTSRDTRLEFDWNAGIVRGEHENMPVELPLKPGMQDRMSVQVLIMQKLASGIEPGKITFVDRDETKEYTYTREGTEVLHTAIGDLETVVYSSKAEGSTRESRIWYAPSLGFLPVRGEQARRGKVETQLTVLTVERP